MGDEERRIVTVLFADLVGFTALSEHRDPEEVKHIVDRAFERLVRDITSFGGVVDKVMGDGIIALFGAPVAHEDDAERAVRAGLRMQQTLKDLSAELEPPVRMRVGVNTGEVLVGTPSGGEYTAMGDVVNSAERLQGLAEPGQTLVGGATRLATGDAITYLSAGQLPAKGREAPIEAWVAIRAVRLPGFQRHREVGFVARRHELDLLAAQGRMAVDGNRAQLSLVVGDAGIGKSRLVREAAAHLANHSGAVVLEGRCLPYGEANVWWPVAELVRSLFDLPVDGPPEEMAALLRQHLRTQIDGADPDDVERFTTAMLHAFGYDTELRGGDRNRNRSEVTLAFTMVLEAELARRPVVLVVSDMHWAPPAVWGLVRQALSELARSSLVVLMTMRPVTEPELPRGRHGLAVLQLGPLDSAASAELLVELGLDADDGHLDELVDRSGGNPFFLEELAGLVATHGHGAGTGGEVFDIDLDAVPATLRGTIAARLDALDPSERALLENASVLGRTGSLEALQIVAAEVRAVPREQFEQDLLGLVEQDLLAVDGNRFRFHSDLVRDVAYGRLTKTVRAGQHQGIAQYIERIQGDTVRNSVVVSIAEHYRAAAQLSLELPTMPDLDHDHLVDRALYWLEQAGDRALEASEPRQAARWYDYGVELALDDETLARFVFGRARARAEVHDLPGARADLERLYDLPRLDPAIAAQAVLVRGDVNRKAGDLYQAVTDLVAATERLDQLGLRSQQALALRLLGMTEMARSDEGAAQVALEASRKVAMEAGDRRSEGWALQTMAWHAFVLGRVTEAKSQLDDAIEIFSELDDNGALMWTQGLQAWVSFHTGDWAEARQLIDAVLPEIRRRGDPWAEAITMNLDASLELWSGRADRAKQLAREARAVADAIGEVALAVMARAIEGRALVSLGRFDEGTLVLDEAFSVADQADDDDGRRTAVVTSCASAARLGEPERAIRWAARHDEVVGDPSVVGEIDLVVSLALALLQRGAVEEAEQQLEWVTAGEGIGHFANAVGALVAAAGNDHQFSDELTTRALAGNSTYLDRVVALLARASICCGTGDRVGCDEALAAARAEVEPTDDQLTRHLIELAAGICGQVDLDDATTRMRGAGLDPTGWKTAFDLAVNPAGSMA